ncbi:Proteasome subunit beta type-4; Flags: Precursor [Serendipita indica DSM 11827]|uniref:Proteasome subunit beta n=1 Tax=Serendipita indica (strain DSM 11827) TaxID=1109443 RepID=G4TEZ7_SERID|nr:Proteasome subunit beta type-4; Flags: Precursor [Serendipita indica DSM 11827]CCA69873.1 probable PRE4-20S proteasome subunit (beta7) [Serendipita indica DSM 11827]
MDHHPTNWGRPRDDRVDPYGTFPIHARPRPAKDVFADGVQRTQQPIVTGTSVIGLKYSGGVMLAADNLASYGSLARYKDVQRLHPVGTSTVVGAGGDMSDFQHLQHMLDSLVTEEFTYDDGNKLGPTEIYEYLSRVMYGRRSKMDPLWNALVVGGVKPNGESFLGYVDLLGTTYQSPTIATGFGAYIAQPLLRNAVDERPDPLSEEEAVKVIQQCMKALFYRDARSLNKYQIAKVTSEGVTISDPLEAPTVWGFAEGIRGYGAQTQ